MATPTGRNLCVRCGKDKATLRCGGCLQEFCFNHLADHRQELNKQLDEVEVTRDLFRQTLNERTTDPHKHASIQQIDKWEHDSVQRIRKIAEEARQTILKHATEHNKQIEADLNKLTDQLRQSREENDFSETDLRHWNEELMRLSKEVTNPSNMILREDTTSSLINKISVHITTSKLPLSHLIVRKIISL
jgi:hypothetical protein